MSGWDALARYNAEKARGIVHTPEYDARMAEEQEWFDNRRGEVVVINGYRTKRDGNVYEFIPDKQNWLQRLLKRPETYTKVEET